jgi:acetolactate decarboxylase
MDRGITMKFRTKNHKITHIKTFMLFTAFLAFSPAVSSALEDPNDVLFQPSVITALMQGVFDGSMTYEELSSHGDFGLGTFNGLDGEMVEVDGQFYQVKADGAVYPVNSFMKTPFAIVTYFTPDKEMNFHASGDESTNLTLLQRYLENQMPSKNIFYAIRIDGVFDYIKTRSVPAQVKPYPTLTEAVKNQSIFEMFNQSGTVIGFWSPAFAGGINLAGYHFHFLNDKRTAGGHVLDLRLKNASIALDYTPEFFVNLPNETEFLQADLGGTNQGDLKKAESNAAPAR